LTVLSDFVSVIYEFESPRSEGFLHIIQISIAIFLLRAIWLAAQATVFVGAITPTELAAEEWKADLRR
jgi:hypothetical protein